jgi:uncharacterized protein
VTERLLTIIGASTRAAAQSARRAFFAPIAGDLFADLDLLETCPATHVDEYPRGLEQVLRGPQSGGWMYTGALENYPDLIEGWSAIRPLYGNDTAVLRRVRDPMLIVECLRSANLPFLPVVPSSEGLPRDGSWLCKPLRSAAGNRIEPWTREAAAGSCTYPTYFQRFKEGTTCSAVYVASQGDAKLLGVTRQLLEESSFRYLGSIGPTPLDEATRQQFCILGQTLAAEFQLVGLFGVDAVLNSDGVWPVEINPRYTASVEVLERALGIHSIAMHVTACCEQTLPTTVPTVAHRIVGKAIHFAEEDCTVMLDLRTTFNALADVPAIGTQIHKRSPVATVFAEGNSDAEVQQSLKAALSAHSRWIRTGNSASV